MERAVGMEGLKECKIFKWQKNPQVETKGFDDLREQSSKGCPRLLLASDLGNMEAEAICHGNERI